MPRLGFELITYRPSDKNANNPATGEPLWKGTNGFDLKQCHFLIPRWKRISVAGDFMDLHND